MERRTTKSKVMVRNILVLLLLAGVLCAPSARAEVGKYSISWHTFTTCGGGTSTRTDPNYTVRGSIGQPLAEKRAEGLDEGKHRITGGFWGGAYKSWYPIFVKADARGDDNGTSWAHAFTSLQDALDAAQYCTGPEIVVAAGAYCPDYYGHDENFLINPNYKGGREATFQLVNGAETYGGFPEGGGSWDDRDVTGNETILSGDIGEVGNDSDNSYHVINGSGTNPNAVLDGFTITAGNANDENVDDQHGGGMYNINGSPTLIRCTFRGNVAILGGGLYNHGNNAKPKFVYCTFTDNKSVFRDEGGGGDGGAVYNTIGSSPDFIQSLFIGNVAKKNGGAIFNYAGNNVSVVCCNIIGNRALGGKCGGIWNHEPDIPVFKNSIFWANIDEDDSTAKISEQIYFTDDPPTKFADHCCLQGLKSFAYENENIGTDPNFVDPGSWKTQENFIVGNYHLNLDSPCINAGNPNYVPMDNEYDLDGQPRVVGCRVDMGIDEYVLTGDFDFSGAVDMADYTFFARYWLSDHCDDLPGADMDWCYGTDLDKNRRVANPDLFLFTEHWLYDLPACNE